MFESSLCVHVFILFTVSKYWMFTLTGVAQQKIRFKQYQADTRSIGVSKFKSKLNYVMKRKNKNSFNYYDYSNVVLLKSLFIFITQFYNYSIYIKDTRGGPVDYNNYKKFTLINHFNVIIVNQVSKLYSNHMAVVYIYIIRYSYNWF